MKAIMYCFFGSCSPHSAFCSSCSVSTLPAILMIQKVQKAELRLIPESYIHI